ncbi:MAG: hypothetical protein KAU03_04940, partial [Candidatus Altiarchaeales archaeon]|nr:hypothetical protein [Candidatus Altiarchaeales archaeon]
RVCPFLLLAIVSPPYVFDKHKLSPLAVDGDPAHGVGVFGGATPLDIPDATPVLIVLFSGPVPLPAIWHNHQQFPSLLPPFLLLGLGLLFLGPLPFLSGISINPYPHGSGLPRSAPGSSPAPDDHFALPLLGSRQFLVVRRGYNPTYSPADVFSLHHFIPKTDTHQLFLLIKQLTCVELHYIIVFTPLNN